MVKKKIIYYKQNKIINHADTTILSSEVDFALLVEAPQVEYNKHVIQHKVLPAHRSISCLQPNNRAISVCTEDERSTQYHPEGQMDLRSEH